jgi:hypothetical protein
VSNRPRLKADEDDVNTDSVKRAGTGNSIANGAETIVVGACYELSDDPTNYSPASMPTLCDGRVQWPDLLAPGDTCEAMSGIPAAGATSGLTVRLNGTSVAAPQVSRAIMNLFGRKNGPKRMASREIVAALVGKILLPRDGPSTPQMRDGLSRGGAGRLDTGIK